MISIKELLPSVINRLKLKEQTEIKKIISCWEEIIGQLNEKYQNKSKPLYLNKGVLIVGCLNSVIINEFQLRRQEIIKRINQELGEELVREIKLKQF